MNESYCKLLLPRVSFWPAPFPTSTPSPGGLDSLQWISHPKLQWVSKLHSWTILMKSPAGTTTTKSLVQALLQCTCWMLRPGGCCVALGIMLILVFPNWLLIPLSLQVYVSNSWTPYFSGFSELILDMGRWGINESTIFGCLVYTHHGAKIPYKLYLIYLRHQLSMTDKIIPILEIRQLRLRKDKQ